MHKPFVDRSDLMRRIQGAGVPIQAESDRIHTITTPGVFVRLHGGVTESTIFDWYGGTGFIINVTLTFNMQNFVILAFGLELAWTNEVCWLPDPHESGSGTYLFSRTLQFDRDLVLNHYADVRRIHPRKSSITGCLLGTANASIPDEVHHGMSVPAFLDVFDEMGVRTRKPISLWADRSRQHLLRTAPKLRRKALFEVRDRIPAHTPANF